MEGWMRLRLLLLAGLLAVSGASGPARVPDAPADDPFTWLEEIRGERALAWARGESSRTLGELQGDPRYQANYDRALEILQARDRIPARTTRPGPPYILGPAAPPARPPPPPPPWPSPRPGEPQWETVLDIDALAA